jgi:hypothetical protein
MSISPPVIGAVPAQRDIEIYPGGWAELGLVLAGKWGAYSLELWVYTNADTSQSPILLLTQDSGRITTTALGENTAVIVGDLTLVETLEIRSADYPVFELRAPQVALQALILVRGRVLVLAADDRSRSSVDGVIQVFLPGVEGQPGAEGKKGDQGVQGAQGLSATAFVLGATAIPTTTAEVATTVTGTQQLQVGSTVIGQTGGLYVTLRRDNSGYFLARLAPGATGVNVPAGAELFIDSLDPTRNNRLALLERVADARDPLRPATWGNLVRDRVAVEAGVFSSNRFVLGTAAAPNTTHKTFREWNPAAEAKFNEPYAVRVEGQASSAAVFAPQVAVTILASELPLLGIVPDDVNPPTVSARIAISKIMTNLDPLKIQNNAGALGSSQIWIEARYGLNTESTPNYSTVKSVYWVNGSAGALSAGAAYPGFNSTAVYNDDGDFIIYRRTGMKIRATLGGEPLSSIKIHVIPKPTLDTTLAAYSISGLALIAGSNIDQYAEYVNSEDFALHVSESNLSDALLAQVRASRDGIVLEELTVRSVPSVIVDGDSIYSGGHTLQFMNSVHLAAVYSQWLLRNQSVSGESIEGLRDRFERNLTALSNAGQGPTYWDSSIVIIAGGSNDRSEILNEPLVFMDTLRIFAASVQARGMTAVLMPEVGRNTLQPQLVRDLMNRVALETGAIYYDPNELVDAWWNQLDDPAYLTLSSSRFHSNQHFGWRKSWWLARALADFLNRFDPPERNLRLFEVRDGVDLTVSLDAALTDDAFDLRTAFEEFEHGSIVIPPASEQYFDRLDIIGAFAQVTKRNKILDGLIGPIAVKEFVLMKGTIPSNSQKTATLAVRVPVEFSTVYVRSVLTTFVDPARYLSVEMDGTGMVLNSQYTFSNLAGTHVFKGVWNGFAQFRPLPDANASNVTLAAGTITRTSGTGPASVNFTKAFQGRSSAFYAARGRGLGTWVALTPVNGIVTLDPKKHLIRGNDLEVLFRHQTIDGGSISSLPSIIWSGRIHKMIRRGYTVPKPATGLELLVQTRMGNALELGAWDVAPPGAAAIGQPEDVWLPDGFAGKSTLAVGGRIGKAVNFPASNKARTLRVSVLVRWWSPVWNAGAVAGAAANSATVNEARFWICAANGTDYSQVKSVAGPAWYVSSAEFVIPPGQVSITPSVLAGVKPLEILEISTQFVED